jgi:hypothetical protein
MKYSEEVLEVRADRLNFTNARWGQLNQLTKEASDRAIHYLLFTNSGGAIATLSFLGAVPAVRTQVPPKVALACFILGLILLGIHAAIWIHFVDYLFKNWRENVLKYWNDEIDWEKLTEDDDKRSYKTAPLYLVGYASFGCFIIGAVIGLCFTKVW